MSSAAQQRPLIPFTEVEQLREARAILRTEADALETLAGQLDASFCQAVQLISACTGRVVLTGIGKAGLIARKIVATLSSTGAPAQFLHPAEALHGDLGCVQPHDVILALSNSGETEEVCGILPVLRHRGVPLIALTSRDTSTLARSADITIALGRMQEAGQHGLAPSTSTTAMLAVGDALALVASRLKGFTAEDFARCHPGGSLGQQLRPVREVMRSRDELRIAATTDTVREANALHALPGRRTGAIIVVDEDNHLAGLFTDSDLARILEHRHDALLDGPIGDVMTANPLTLPADALLCDAVTLMSGRKISELPVVDSTGQPIGLIDITDVIGLIPQTAEN